MKINAIANLVTAIIVAGIGAAPSSGQAQATKAAPHFDAASVKLAPNFSPVKHRDSGRINYEGIDTVALVLKAFGVPRYLIVWPDWIPAGLVRTSKLDQRYYQIEATMPPETSDAQLQLMLQDLLRERFHLALHREQRDLQFYEITIADGGIRMRESPPVDMSKAPANLAGNEDLERLIRGPMLSISINPDGLRLKGQITIGRIGDWLNPYLPHPIMDKTGIDKNKYYDVDIPWSFNPNDPPPSPELPPNKANASYMKELIGVMQKNLGLKVQLRTAPTEFIVIDSMDHVPTEN